MHFSLLRNFAFLFTMVAASVVYAEEIDVWIGTGGRPSRGIYHCTLDSQTGKLTESQLVAEITAPGFLAMHPSLPILYAVGAQDGLDYVISYEILGKGATAQLQLQSRQEIGDSGTHLAVSRDGLTLLTAQYGGGSVAAFPLENDGKVKPKAAWIHHKGGSNVFPGRQNEPHAHWIGFSPDEKFALVPDLGLDQVVIYAVDTKTASMSPHGVGVLPPGSGPRHLKFHPNGKWAYVLNELDLTVSLLDWDAQAGSMKLRQTIPTVAKEELEPLKFKSCSEIRIHPNGKYLYAANRGHDSITVFAVGDDGTLTSIQNEAVRGATPRNFNLDPSAKWLLVGGQDSHTLGSFAISPDSGKLVYNYSVISTPTPICILFEHE